MGKKEIKSFSLGGKNRNCASRGPRKTAEGLRMGRGRGALRQKYYWELIKNDK
jgi:hypothetical protein